MKKLREAGFYYIDKTGLIQQLLQNWGEVNLFTRSRRFGKTLNMSMLKNFFEIGADSTLFDGLYISQNEKMCEEYMGKYPVVFLSLKGVDGLNFEDAKDNFRQLIGYYQEMVSLLRGFFGQALKTNEFLQFAVLTGCLRVSKESIFTGLNNFEINSIVDIEHDEQFGFTEDEVHKLLEDYQLTEYDSDIKEWYDGYRFGDTEIYCPWDVMNYVKKLVADPNARPDAFWINTSSNDLVKRFVDKADKTTRDEIEQLIAGEAIEKNIRLDLTYDEIDNSIDNLWSVLFTTGYLTRTGGAVNGAYRLVIPNREIREVFIIQIQEWFKQTVMKDAKPVQEFCKAFLEGNAEEIQKRMTAILDKSISILDTKARDEYKENFYHGLLIGLLRSEPEWLIKSNKESGDGFCDIFIEPENPDAGIVIEVKYSASLDGMEKMCETALRQIKDRRYDEELRNDGREDILAYGIAFCKKRCWVICERL